jgi:hypothetical protein
MHYSKLIFGNKPKRREDLFLHSILLKGNLCDFCSKKVFLFGKSQGRSGRLPTWLRSDPDATGKFPDPATMLD